MAEKVEFEKELERGAIIFYGGMVTDMFETRQSEMNLGPRFIGNVKLNVELR